MRKATLLLLTLCVAGCGNASHNSARQLFGLEERDSEISSTHVLVRVSPRTLQPLGPGLNLRDYVSSRAFSPDGKELAFGSSALGEVLYVDAGNPALVTRQTVMPGHRRLGGMEIDVEGWPRRNLLIAVATRTGTWWAPHPSWLLVVDPEARRVVRRTPLAGTVVASASPYGRTVALLVERARFPRIVIVEPDGSTWARTLARIGLGGLDGVRLAGTYYPPRRAPALATDGHGTLFVAASDRPLAEIDVRARNVRYHDVELQRRYLSLPPAMTPGSGGVNLRFGTSATWLGRHELAIGGFDELPAPIRGYGAGQREGERVLQIVDTRNWRARPLRATFCRRVNEIKLCSATARGFPPDGKGARGPSLIAYGSNWRRLYDRPSPELWWDVSADRLFAGSAEGTRISELDPRTGRTIRRIVPSPLRNQMWPLDLFAWRPR